MQTLKRTIKRIQALLKGSAKAQTAMELAVFGSVILFIVGMMVRQAFSANFNQNQNLRAMRMAMSLSMRTAHGQKGYTPRPGVPSAARNVASILFLEDRVTPSADKYGALTRTPFIATGSGGASQNFFLPVDFGEDENLSRFDLFINGKHFTFTTGAFNSITSLHLDPGGDPDFNDWIPECAARTNLNTSTNIYYTEVIGCRAFYTQIVNYAPTGVIEYCYRDCTNTGPDGCCLNFPPAECDGFCANLPADERFDLDRNPFTSDVVIDDGTMRENFTWQWYLIKAFAPDRSQVLGWDFGVNYFDPTGPLIHVQVNIPYTVDCSGRGSTGPAPNPSNCRPFSEGIIFRDDQRDNTVVDVDKDLFEEFIIGFDTQNTGALRTVYYIDNQEGDLDTTRDNRSLGDSPGLLDRMTIYSFTKDGTFLRLEEGKLLNPTTDQFIRNVQKRDRVDLIERVYQLSNDTGHFCGNGTPSNPNGGTCGGCTDCCDDKAFGCACVYWDVPKGTPNLTQNPDLEACNNCFDANNIDKSCFEEGSNLLYIRSRIQDLGGSKWMTSIQ